MFRDSGGLYAAFDLLGCVCVCACTCACVCVCVCVHVCVCVCVCKTRISKITYLREFEFQLLSIQQSLRNKEPNEEEQLMTEG